MAVPTSPPEHQPSKQRDVVIPLNGRRAARTPGAMTVERLQLLPETDLGGEPVDADIQETADAATKHEEESQDKRSRQVVQHHVDCSCVA